MREEPPSHTSIPAMTLETASQRETYCVREPDLTMLPLKKKPDKYSIPHQEWV